METRKLQKAEWEAFYQSVPEDRRLLKRRRLDGPVRDNDQVDEHRQGGEAKEKGREEISRFARRIAPGLHSEMPDKDLEFALKLGKGDEVLLLSELLLLCNLGVVWTGRQYWYL